MLRHLKQLILTTLFALFASQASAMFIQPDWYDPTRPGVGTNRYAYSFNDPINLSDSNGNEVGPEDHDDPTDLARELQEEDPELFGELSNNYDLSELPLDDPRFQALIESYKAYAAGCGGPCPGGVIDRFINGGPGAEIQRQIGAAVGIPGVEASQQAQIATVAGAMAFGAGVGGRVRLATRPTPQSAPDISGIVPSGWASQANRKGVETRWSDPNNRRNGVRVDLGNPNHSLPSQRVDHVIVRSNGQVIGRNGTPIQGSIRDNAVQAHIPLSEYRGWSTWNSP